MRICRLKSGLKALPLVEALKNAVQLSTCGPAETADPEWHSIRNLIKIGGTLVLRRKFYRFREIQLVRPDFAKHIDPILMATMQYADRLEGNERLVPGEVYAELKRKLDKAEEILGKSDEWELAKYGLCSMIDDLFITAPWDGRDWWTNNCMERSCFGDRKAHEDFFDHANRASRLTKKDALEVFYLAVILGFRGFYSSPDASYRRACIERFKLPDTIQAWCAQTSRSIQLKQGLLDLPPAEVRLSTGAKPLQGRSRLLTHAVFSIFLLACAIAMVVFFVDIQKV